MAIDHDKWGRELLWSAETIRGWDRLIRAVVVDMQTKVEAEIARRVKESTEERDAEIERLKQRLDNTEVDRDNFYEAAKVNLREAERLQAEVARLTAELAEAATKERKRIAEVVNWAHEAHPLACRWDFKTMMQVHADAIARGEPRGENRA